MPIVWNLRDTQVGHAYAISMDYALGQGSVTSTSATEFDLVFGSDSITFKGNFTLDGQGKITGGTITGFEVYHGFTKLAEASGYAIPVASFVFALIDYQTNPPGPAGGGEKMRALLDGDGRTVNGSGNGDLVNGTDFVDHLYGNGGGDGLLGGGGNDLLFGGSGNDLIEGGDGDDTLDGGTGADKMAGGEGNDTYIVDNAGDEIFEAPLEGKDTVRATVSFTLGDNVEDLILTGSGNSNGAGNGLANVITGNAGNNLLTGRGGKDTLDGGAGADTASYAEKGQSVSVTLSGATKATVFVNGVAEDTVRNIENVIGGSGDDALTGDTSANVLNGGGGNDRLSGGKVKDTLIGGGGADQFVFDVKAKKKHADKITDFSVGEDTIVLDNGVFKALKGKVLKGGDYFRVGKKAEGKKDFVIYNEKSGKLSYDADGKGEVKAKLIAKLDSGLDLSAADFLVI